MSPIFKTCQRKGHWAAVCRSRRKLPKKVHALETQTGTPDAEEEPFYLPSIQVDAVSGTPRVTPWFVTLQVHGVPLRAKIDICAEVTVISEEHLRQMSRSLPILSPTSALLRGADHGAMKYVRKSLSATETRLHRRISTSFRAIQRRCWD